MARTDTAAKSACARRHRLAEHRRGGERSLSENRRRNLRLQRTTYRRGSIPEEQPWHSGASSRTPHWPRHFSRARDAWRFAERELAAHPAAAAIGATVLDAVGVVGVAIGAVALLPEIATIGGVTALLGAGIAGLGSGLLVAADGVDAYLLLRGDEAAATGWENTSFFRQAELLAPLLVLPDAARSGIGVAREVGDARSELRVAQRTSLRATSQEVQSAEKLEAQKIINAAKAKIYRGDREKIRRIVRSAKMAAKRVRKAEKIRAAREIELRSVILRALKRDGPGLLSAGGGTGLYIGHLPDMLHERNTKTQERKSSSLERASTDLLLPSHSSHSMRGYKGFLTLGITVTSPLTK